MRCDWLLVLLGLPAAWSSTGDREHGYRVCVQECLSSDWEPTASLRLLGWTATANCCYECSWNRTAWRMERGEPPLQYHGKWPFYRLLGVQVLLLARSSFVAPLSALKPIPACASLPPSAGARGCDSLAGERLRARGWAVVLSA
jgi:hypothetical protein